MNLLLLNKEFNQIGIALIINYCLPGITRGNVLALCHELGIEAQERNFSLSEVYGADEALVTGTFAGIAPVASIDGRTIGDGTLGPRTRQLQEAYLALCDRLGAGV